MRKVLLFTWLLVVFLFSNQIKAQDISVLGTEFWLAYTQNSNHPSSEVEAGLSISAVRACQVIVFCYLTGDVYSYSLGAGENRVVIIPSSKCYITNSSKGKQRAAVRVTSTDSISLAAYCNAKVCLDASTIIPTHSLGEFYVVQTCSPRPHPEVSETPSFVCVVATQDNTDVRVAPSRSVVKSREQNDNQLFTTNLNAGDVIYLKSYVTTDSNGDLSGTTVQSLNGKPIAVFSGNQLLVLPQGCSSGDYVYEQAFPINTWGNNFIATRTFDRCADFVKVTAADDNCEVKVGGNIATTLRKNESYQFKLISDVATIQTSQPCCVYQYQTSKSFCPASTVGGPSMVIVPPVEQMIHHSVFSTITPQNQFAGNPVRYHYLNVIVHTADTSTAKLDGSALTDFTEIEGTEFSYCIKPISASVHTLDCGGDGFLARIYGLGEFISYDYIAGVSFRDINPVNTSDIISDNAQLWFPNVITPRQDINNVFKGVGDGICDYRVEIFHRWGEHITTLNSIDESWDGTYKGRYCQQGTYVYQVIYSTCNIPDVRIKRFGSVTLLY